jgi:CRISPR/Cas system CSM-associated protein Csm2 small subunit
LKNKKGVIIMSFKKICFVIGAVAVAAGAAFTGYVVKKASDKRRQTIKAELDDAAKANSNEATENALKRIENLISKKFGRKVREEEPKIVDVLDSDVAEITESVAEDLVKPDDE